MKENCMKKLVTLATTLLLLASAAMGQVRLDIHSTECVRVQDFPSCDLVAHTYQYFDDPTWVDAEDYGQVWTQDCPHTADAAFACPFDWPAGAALTGTGLVNATFHMRSPIDDDGATTFAVCWDARITCRTITGSGDEVVGFLPNDGSGGLGWGFISREMGDSQRDSYIFRQVSTGDIDDAAPGASGAACEFRVKRVTTIGDCAEATGLLGFERFNLTIPAP